MYQKILAVFAVFLSLPAYAAQTKNTMKMVSYFPVPYVAYDTVSANNAMDIGILNQCAMDINKGSTNLGGSACSLYLYGNATGADLNRGLLNVAAGKLDLNSDVTNARIVSKKVQVGTSMTEENGWLDVKIPSGKNDEYDALYISSLKNTGNSFRVTSKEDGAKVNSFHMFNEISNDFPGCAGTVTWQELELAANVNNNETYTDIYLVCNGTGETTEPEEPEECKPPKGNTYTENCPDGQTGIITYTWNQATCSYQVSNTCVQKVTECQPGATKNTGVACAKCGQMVQTCSSDGVWGAAVCSNQKSCEPGDVASWNYYGYAMICSSSCSWEEQCPSGCTEKTDVFAPTVTACCSDSKRLGSKVLNGRCVHPGCNWTEDSDGNIILGNNSFCNINLNCSASDL